MKKRHLYGVAKTGARHASGNGSKTSPMRSSLGGGMSGKIAEKRDAANRRQNQKKECFLQSH